MEEQPKVGPTGLGKMVLFLFVLACIAGAAYYFRDLLAPGGRGGDKQVNLDDFKKVEAPDTKGVTTVNEYKYVPGEKLPPVKGVSAYKWDPAQKVVNFPINVWIGWLPIVAANGGFAPNPDSIFAKKYGFKVNLKLIDDPVVARDAFAAGESHVLWGTLDMMVLFAPDLMKDSRSAPRIFQQVDWSSGGDGIVVRGNIASVADLKGKTVVYAQNSPSQYFINNLLLNAGVQPSSVKHKYTATAFEAAAAFVADKSIDACVSWAPDIYNIPEKVKGDARPHHHRRGQQAHRRRVGRPRRLRQGPPRRDQGPGGRHLRRDGPPQGRHPAREGLPVDGRGLRDAGGRGARDGQRRALHELPGEQGLLPERERPRELRADLEERDLRLPRAGPPRHPDTLRRGDGLLGPPGPRQGRHLRAARRTRAG